MGAGKSTIGWRLSERLSYQFFDTDRVLVKRFKKPIAKIFQQEGEEAFRQAEVDLMVELVGLSNVVVSTGGGTLTREETFSIVQGQGALIYLKAPVEVLFERAIFSRKDRPMLDVPDAEGVFRQRFLLREVFYNRSHLVVETHDKRPETVVDEIMTGLSIEEAPSR
jgi:shikimate kinase